MQGVTSGEIATQDQQGEAEAKADDSASTALSAPAQKVKLGFYMESMSVFQYD